MSLILSVNSGFRARLVKRVDVGEVSGCLIARRRRWHNVFKDAWRSVVDARGTLAGVRWLYEKDFGGFWG